MTDNYMNTVDDNIQEYYRILSKEFPEFLYEYINVPEMQRLGYINQICGAYWRKNNIYGKDMYSVLRHSIGVALIIWNFTKDKKQTLAGLFHDIATPAFKHCIDFLNGDAEKQESTEEETLDIIKNSKEIMSLLNRDNIKVEEIYDYKIYPIADNKTPNLSADRLEYTFMNGYYYGKIWSLEDIKEIYEDIEVLSNEESVEEIGFKSLQIGEKFIKGSSKLWPLWVSSEDTITMYFFADVIKNMFLEKYITKEDLYKLSEQEVINKMNRCEDKNILSAYKKFMNTNEFFECEEYREDKFCVSRKVKRRYINPLVENRRIYDISDTARQLIDEYLNMKRSNYAYIEI